MKGVSGIAGFEDDYLEETDPDDRVARVPLNTMAPEQLRVHLLLGSVALAPGRKLALGASLFLLGRTLLESLALVGPRLQRAYDCPTAVLFVRRRKVAAGRKVVVEVDSDEVGRRVRRQSGPLLENLAGRTTLIFV